MLARYIKRSINATLSYSISILTVRGINFLILPYFLTQLTLTDFGIWDFYQLFFTLGGHVLAGTASHMITRYYVLQQNDLQKQRQAIGNACVFGGLLTLCAFVTGIVLLQLFGALNNFYAISTLITCCSWSLFTIGLSLVRVRENLISYATLFTGHALLATALTFIGVWYGWGIRAFFYANAIAGICFTPLFFLITRKHATYSFTLLKEQLSYAAPIVVQSIGYTGFFTIDRLIITYGAGYAMLGEYALLWRFGALFQFFSIALLDTWFIMSYNAHHEERSHFLLPKLMAFFFILLTSGALAAMAGSRILISFLFPNTYHNLISYLVFFFTSLVVLETARLMQIGSFLSTKTRMLPALTISALTIQGILLLTLYQYGLWGILTANTIAFTIYAYMTAKNTQRTYAISLIPLKRMAKITACFALYATLLHILFCIFAPWYYLALLAITWPITLWLTNCVEIDEKTWAYEQYRSYIKPLLRKA